MYFIGSPSNSSCLPGNFCEVVDVALWSCPVKSFLSAWRIVAIVPGCSNRTFNCWMVATICSSAVDMVILVSLLARSVSRRAQLQWMPTLDLSLTATTDRLLRFLLTGLLPASPGDLRSSKRQVTIPMFHVPLEYANTLRNFEQN